MAQIRKVAVITGEWECMECGYIEEGTELHPPKKCPDCGAPGSSLEFFAYEDDDDFDWERAPRDDDDEADEAEDFEDYEEYDEEDEEEI